MAQIIMEAKDILLRLFELKMDQKTLAEKTGIAPGTISQVINQEIDGLKTRVKITVFFNMLEEEEEQE